MKVGGPLWSLSGSLLLHGLAAAAAIVLVSRESPPSALIVELAEAVRVGEPAAPAAFARAASPPVAVHRSPQPPLRPAAPMATPPAVPAPPSRVESAPAPSSEAASDLPAPASAPGAGSTADAARPSSGFGTGAAGTVQESPAGGGLGAGPLALLAPSAGAGLSPAGPGAGDGGVPAEFGSYLAAFRQRIQESLNYPLAARRRGLGGVVQLEVELLPSGKVASVVLRGSSTHAILDQAALDTVSRLDPAPFPPGVPPRPLKVRVPIVFELK
ncbi:MAG: energy transducer TonB [Candidatus Rokubacteria bacterium]|nr:energy transducer TonB [Candidatus Rokubacteria bacterium]